MAAAALTPAQRTKVEEFCSFTFASDKQARTLLTESNWDVATSAERWFARGMVPEGRRGGAPKIDATAIAAAFNSLKDAELGVINSDGLERLCTEIGVDPFEDYAVLLITYYMQCSSLEAITQEEFTRGFTAMGVSSLKDLKAALPKMREDLSSNASLFDSFYKFAFKANCSEGMRVLTGDVAAGLLRLVLGPRLPIANDFASFIETTGVKTVTRDSWIQLHSFARTVRPDLSNYDPAAAWPVLIDDYVAFKQGKTPKGAKAPGAASGGGGGGGGK